MNIVYFSIGNQYVNHNRCYFSILSLLRYRKEDTIYVYTDLPDYYKTLSPYIEIRELTPERIKEWSGKIGVWRVKTKVIEDLAKQSLQPIVFMDADTFFYKSLDALAENLDRGIAYMHLNEGRPKDMKYTPHRMWKKMNGKTFGGITIDESLCMWNSGIAGIPKANQQECIKLALQIFDEAVDAGVNYYIVEQYSLSIAMNRFYELKPADDFVGHYWGNKPEWDIIILV